MRTTLLVLVVLAGSASADPLAGTVVTCAVGDPLQSVIVAGPPGSAPALQQLADALSQKRVGVVAVELPAEPEQAAQRLREIEASMAAKSPVCRDDAGRLPAENSEVSILMGSAAKMALDCRREGARILVEPELTDAETAQLVGCYQGGGKLYMVGSKCPAALERITRIVHAGQRLEIQQEAWVAFGCGEDGQTLVAQAVASLSLVATSRGTNDLIDDPDHMSFFDLAINTHPPGGEHTERHVSYAVPLTLGFSNHGGSFSARPEVIFLRHGRGTLGLGFHMLVGNAPNAGITFEKDEGFSPKMVGGGLDAVIPIWPTSFDGEIVLQPSVGVYGGDSSFLGAGLFVGHRDAHTLLGVTEFPFGVRADVWFDHDRHQQDFSVTFSVDGLALLAGAALFAWILA